ncbi:MAG: hypothetical protein HY049_05980 [Acidobacteria bacterium]|nr:hypothetical protein [Acidobacteriota bacterium]
MSRIYLWPERNDEGQTVWLAECVTFNLVSSRPTYDEVVLAMLNQIAGYLRVAEEGDPAGLVPRPSPVGRCVSLWLRHLVSRILPRNNSPVYKLDRPTLAPA